MTARTARRPALSAREVLAGSPALARLKGRIVVIGRDDRSTSRLRLPDRREISPAEAPWPALGRDGRRPLGTHAGCAAVAALGLLVAAGLLSLAHRAAPDPQLRADAQRLALPGAGAGLARNCLAWGGIWLAPTLPIFALVLGHLALIARDRWQMHQRRSRGPLLTTTLDEDTVITSYETVTVTTRERTVIRHDEAGDGPQAPPRPAPATPPAVARTAASPRTTPTPARCPAICRTPRCSTSAGPSSTPRCCTRPTRLRPPSR